ncbi:MAG: DUF2141 domain-containing protein [Cytophagales bacterium]|nr:DUF2141 domain-containing protein [Cytophagales bacterium]
MKTLITCAALLWCISTSAQKGIVVLKLSNIQSEKSGEISIGLFTKENFPKQGKQLRNYKFPVTVSNMEVVIEDVPLGTYAIAVYQDINKNGTLETNFIGMPQEPVGFSNNAKIRMGPPDFSEASFTVIDKEKLQLNITLR